MIINPAFQCAKISNISIFLDVLILFIDYENFKFVLKRWLRVICFLMFIKPVVGGFLIKYSKFVFVEEKILNQYIGCVDLILFFCLVIS